MLTVLTWQLWRRSGLSSGMGVGDGGTVLVDECSAGLTRAVAKGEHHESAGDCYRSKWKSLATSDRNQGEQHRPQNGSARPDKDLSGLFVRFDHALGHNPLDAILLGLAGLQGHHT